MKGIPIRLNRVILAFVLALSSFSFSFSQEGDAAKGKQLFNQNCAACHALNRKMTGPALANVEQRLAETEGLDRQWLYTWIKNSSGMIASGDDYANRIYNEYNKAAMTAFPTLSNEDIDNILAYTAAPAPAPVVIVVSAPRSMSEQSERSILVLVVSIELPLDVLSVRVPVTSRSTLPVVVVILPDEVRSVVISSV